MTEAVNLGPEAVLADRAEPLDSLLVQAALGPVRRLAPDGSVARLARRLAGRPGGTGRRLAQLGAESLRIAVGASELAASPRDRRFEEPGWSDNPLLKRTLQLYLATHRTAQELLADADLEWEDHTRVSFLLENLAQALAPSNLPLLNPASAKAAIDTGGLSLLRGGSQLVKDLAAPPRVPQMVDESQFEVGRNIAVTPGSVVFRNDVLELIQYHPDGGEVYEVPLLIVPPTINKYYAIDLAPGRSLVEHSVGHGRQLFVISWRNPDARHADWGFETYVDAILEALAAVERITGTTQTALAGICSGGILAAITASYLAGTGALNRIAAMCLAVTVIDSTQAGMTSALVSRRTAEAAKAKSRRQGYLDGRALAEVFAWLRPGDLIWNYWVNNYLLGKRPPAFDILFWNADTTRMTAQLHADFVDLSLDNLLSTPGAISIHGVPIDLGAVDVDSYVLAGIADHITPWQNCYRTTKLLGGQSRFVLSSSGHIAALVKPAQQPQGLLPRQPGHLLVGRRVAGRGRDPPGQLVDRRQRVARRPVPRRSTRTLGARRPRTSSPGCRTRHLRIRPMRTGATNMGNELHNNRQEEMRSVSVLGHRVRVSVRRGTGTGPPLLVCNGIGASLEVLDAFVAHVDPAIEVVRFDVPGVGGSSAALLPYRFSGLALFAGRLMTRLGYGAFSVLGISWGGGLAQQIALQSPRRCRRVVLVSTATGALMVPASPRLLLKMATPRRYTDRNYAVSIASDLYGGQLRRDPDLVRSLLHDHARLGSPTGYLFQLLAAAGWTSLPLLHLIRQPALILAGDDDPIIPLVNAKIMRRMLPRASLHVFPDGHLGLVTLAEDLGPRVSRFLLDAPRTL